MDQNIGRSFSRSQITESGTQRTTFYWVEPGRVLRRELVGNGIVNNLDFTMNPATGAPFGYTVLEDGALATDALGVEGAGRLVFRFVGDQFAIESQQFKRGQWAQWRILGMARGNNYWRSDAAIAQAQQGRSEMFGMLGAVVGGIAAGAQTNGDMTAITAGMAAGSGIAAPNSEIASAANTNFQAERERYEAAREQERRAMAAVNNPNSLSTPQSDQGSSPSNQAAAEGGMRSHTTRAYFVTGLVPTADNTRNPLCYSTPFTITFMTPADHFVDQERAQAAAARHVQLFLAKCSQLGRVDSGTPFANLEGLTSGWPYPALHAEDKQVLIP